MGAQLLIGRTREARRGGSVHGLEHRDGEGLVAAAQAPREQVPRERGVRGLVARDAVEHVGDGRVAGFARSLAGYLGGGRLADAPVDGGLDGDAQRRSRGVALGETCDARASGKGAAVRDLPAYALARAYAGIFVPVE